MTSYFIGIIWLFFLKREGATNLGRGHSFLLLPHVLNNVPLFAEGVKFFPEESILAIPIYFEKSAIPVLVID